MFNVTVNQTGKNLRLKIHNEVSESHKAEKQCFSVYIWTRRPGVLRFMESQRVGHD